MAKNKFMKQATISSLKGVVVYEDFLRHKSILEYKNQNIDDLLDSLSYLSNKKPCKEALVMTDIGAAVQSLCSHKNEEISKKACDLLSTWNENMKCPKQHCQPTLEVRYDLKTQHFRNTAVKYFSKELGDSEDDRKLADALEKQIFHRNNRLVSKSYKKTTRKIIFALKHKVKEKDLLKSGKITINDFVSKF